MLDTDRQEALDTVSTNAGGSCRCGSPMLASLGADTVICGGIGAGALDRLAERGITVYATDAETVGTALELLRAGRLAVLRDGTCYAGDDHGAHNCHAH
jgi:predicted Fe-Mo cluster-binding NifX family protein